MVPYHTIAFSQQKLRAALRRSADHDPALAYGFVVHTRRTSVEPTLGIITVNGESMVLTERLVAALEQQPLWLFGHARISLEPGQRRQGGEEAAGKRSDQPLASLLMHIATFDANPGVTQNLVQVEAVVKAETLVQPLLVLASSRPISWPL